MVLFNRNMPKSMTGFSHAPLETAFTLHRRNAAWPPWLFQLPVIIASNFTYWKVIIPPTYEVCGVYSFRCSVRPFVRTFVCSFVFPSQGQSSSVKVYKTSYFEDPLIDFVHIWYDGRYRSKVFYQHHPHPGGDLGVKVTDLEFS